MNSQALPGRRFAGVFLLYAAVVLVLSTVLRDRFDAAQLGQVMAWLGLLAIPPLYLLAWQWFRAADELQQRIFGESVLIAVFASGFFAALVQVAVILAWLPAGWGSTHARDLGGFASFILWYAVWRWRRWSYR